MVLKQLEIQGFKSFPDRVKIPFGPGVTGVVGPNGSGKSNLSDAVRWVLGETSSRQLRSAGKMEQVIFGGTRRRGAMGYATVQLTLDNTDHTLDLAAEEVTISRRYYRSGECEYHINGQPCRLKDIYELLLDTGVGRDGYSIIGQGQISEIVSAKGAERREIFEEACGIAKYRYRKNEAEQRLAAAQENLERLQDILSELESRVLPLEKESEKARQCLALMEQRKGVEVTLWSEELAAAKENERICRRGWETAQAEYERFDRAEQAAQKEAEEIRMQAQRLTVAIERLNGDIRSLTQQISGSESRIAVLENDLGHSGRSADSLRAQLEGAENARKEALAAREDSRAQLKQLEADAAALEEQIAAFKERQAGVQKQAEASGAKADLARAALADCTARLTAARVEEAGALAAAGAARQQTPAAQKSLEEQQAALEQLAQDRRDTARYLGMLDQNEKRLTNVRAGLELKAQSRAKALNEASEAESQLARQREAAASRLSVLQELERNLDGYQNSVKAVLRAASSGRLRGILGPVSSILQVEPGCELAVETALGGALQNIVVENEAAARSAIAFLRKEGAGRATFLPLDTVQPGLFRGQLPEGARLASSLVRTEERYANILSNLLGRILVTEDLASASAAAKALGYHNKVVTLDGQVIHAGGSFTGGSVQRSAGLFTRKKEMEQLTARLAQLEKRLAEAAAKTAACRAASEKLSAQQTAAASEQITAAADRARAEAEGKRLETAAQEGQQELEHRKAELARLEELAAQKTREAEAAAEKRQQLEGEISALSAQLEQLAAGDDRFFEEIRRLGQELSDAGLRRLALQKDAELCRSRLADQEQRLTDADARRQALEESLGALGSEEERIRAEIDGLRRSCEAGRAQIADKEQGIRRAAADRLERQGAETAAQLKARQAAQSREEMSREMTRQDERRAAAKAECDQAAAKLWDEYHLTPTEAAKLCVEYTSLSALRALSAQLRSQIRALGSVNLGAVEEYQEVKQRYDTLRAQVEDVEESKARLTRMIAELCGQMRQIFSDSFRVINENFGRIFAELFGGGEACLMLEQTGDVLTGGIDIHVAPPGKVIRNLEALSGGERALVAICIYFAILAVNPAPFCILDEIEAALDDANVGRFAQYLHRISSRTQFIVITHRRGTMEAADLLYGVTMQEDGVSKLLKLDLEQVDASVLS